MVHLNLNNVFALVGRRHVKFGDEETAVGRKEVGDLYFLEVSNFAKEIGIQAGRTCQSAGDKCTA